jgi:SAM-dependent methyltransferase
LSNAQGDVRTANAVTAAQYDAVPYEAPLLTLLDVSRLRGVASLYAPVRPVADVLDLGCGTGAQLARAATEAAGQLVGVDISAESCARATARLSDHAGRTRILTGDLLDQGETLGEFDLIYVLGVIFAAPPAVRASIIDLVGRRLRPGGVAAISYYGGTIPAVRGNLHAILRAAIPPAAPHVDAVRMAREALRQITASLGDLSTSDSIQLALSQTAALPDDQFLYQVLSPTFDAIRTTELEAALRAHGLCFATYLPLQGVGAEPESQTRALAADALDLRFGSYHCAVFFKPEAAPHRLDVTSGRVAWRSNFTRPNPGKFAGPAQFQEVGGPRSGTVNAHLTQAMLDVLGREPLTFAAAREAGARALAGYGMASDPDASVISDFEALWTHGLITAIGL